MFTRYGNDKHEATLTDGNTKRRRAGRKHHGSRVAGVRGKTFVRALAVDRQQVAEVAGRKRARGGRGRAWQVEMTRKEQTKRTSSRDAQTDKTAGKARTRKHERRNQQSNENEREQTGTKLRWSANQKR
ncbi:hypothetical protein R1flu_015678 [Riccia fluitans]|uniref:Uncharacterized protein n=1 Tax=Riccia fluitans TaxID=41844 RepID=A0ABD1YJQ2_9MARC